MTYAEWIDRLQREARSQVVDLRPHEVRDLLDAILHGTVEAARRGRLMAERRMAAQEGAHAAGAPPQGRDANGADV